MKIKFKKQIIALAIINIVILFSLWGTACANQTITEYKLIKADEITELVNNKVSNRYAEDNWKEICEIAERGKSEIELLHTKQEVDLAFCKTKIEIDSINPLVTDDIRNNVYFLAEDSWELYIRNYAKNFGKDEKWIKNALNNQIADGAEELLCSKSKMNAVIYQHKITVSLDGRMTYQLLNEGSACVGRIANLEIKLWALNDDLYIRNENETFHFKINNSYSLTDSNVETLEKPNNVRYNYGGDGLNFLMAQWDYKAEYGTIGAEIEIKSANSQEFIPVKVEQVFLNQFTIQFESSQFQEGDNYIRIRHVGGAQINNKNTITVYEDSDYTTFSVKIINGAINEII